MTRDFTLSRYRELCESLLSSGYNTITVQEYIQGQVVKPFVILRHDVDELKHQAGDKCSEPPKHILFISLTKNRKIEHGFRG